VNNTPTNGVHIPFERQQTKGATNWFALPLGHVQNGEARTRIVLLVITENMETPSRNRESGVVGVALGLVAWN
jgi:hypothetical protein